MVGASDCTAGADGLAAGVADALTIGGAETCGVTVFFATTFAFTVTLTVPMVFFFFLYVSLTFTFAVPFFTAVITPF